VRNTNRMHRNVHVLAARACRPSAMGPRRGGVRYNLCYGGKLAMVQCKTLDELATHIPNYMVQQRALLLFDEYHAAAGVEETKCPACGGQGHVTPDPLKRCPICKGWGEVPRSLAVWFKAQTAAETSLQTIREKEECHAAI